MFKDCYDSSVLVVHPSSTYWNMLRKDDTCAFNFLIITVCLLGFGVGRGGGGRGLVRGGARTDVNSCHECVD